MPMKTRSARALILSDVGGRERQRGPKAGKVRADSARAKRQAAKIESASVTSAPALVVATSPLRLRSGYSLDTERVGFVPKGKRVSVVAAGTTETLGRRRVEVVVVNASDPASPGRGWITAVDAEGRELLRGDAPFGAHVRRLQDAHWKQWPTASSMQAAYKGRKYTYDRRPPSPPPELPLSANAAVESRHRQLYDVVEESAPKPTPTPSRTLQEPGRKVVLANRGLGAFKNESLVDTTDDVLERLNAALLDA